MASGAKSAATRLTEFVQVDDAALVRRPVEHLMVEQLLGKMRQALDVMQQAHALRLLLQQFGARAQDGDRRAQFMRRVGEEAVVPVVAVGEAGQRLVEGMHQRRDLLRHAA